MPRFRTLLILGRSSNLPTVWSNCCAGYALGGGTELSRFFGLLVGATLLYVGGMFLNDAFDAEFDRQHRAERPIPSGKITEREVWIWGFICLGLGLAFFLWQPRPVGALALLLALSIVLYDAVHKAVNFAPVLMANCRMLLYFLAAASGGCISGLAVWSALVMACYIVGVSYIARKESTRGMVKYWPCLFLVAPLILGRIVNDGVYHRKALLMSVMVILWMIWSLRHTFWKQQRNIGNTVGGLLAGIVLIDWLAIGGGGALSSLVFLSLFAGALIFQRFIPAT